MGEISFNYNVKTEPMQEVAFKYWFSESIEYSIAYQRYIAFSDASIFNSPVAITKVATGLSQLRWLFADRQIGGLIYTNLINSLQKSRESTRKESILFIKQQKQETDLSNDTHVDGDRSGIGIYAKVPAITKDDPIVNIDKEESVKKDRNSMEFVAISSLKANRNVLNIHDDLLFEDVHNDVLNVYQQIYASTDKNKLNLIANMYGERINDSTLNIYEVLFGESHNLNANIIENVSAQTHDSIANILKNVSLSSFDNNLNAENSINVSPINNILLNKFDIHFASQDILKLDSLKNILTEKADVIHGNIIKQIDLKPRYVNNMTTQDVIFGRRYNEINIWLDDEEFALRDDKKGTKFNNVDGAIRNFKCAFKTKQYSVHLYEKPSDCFNTDNFVSSEGKYCYTLDNVMVNKDLKNMYKENTMHPIFKGNKNAYTEINLFINSNDKRIMVSSMTYVLKNTKASHTDDTQLFTTNDSKLMHSIDKPLFIGKVGSQIGVCEQLFINKNEFGIDLFDIKSFIKDSDRITLYKKQDTIIKDEFSIRVYNSNVAFSKENKDILIENDSATITKNEGTLNIKKLNNVFIQKAKRSMLIKNSLTGAYRDSNKMYLFTNAWIDKEPFSMSLLSQTSVDRDSYCMSILEQCQADIESDRISIFKQGQQFIKELTTIKILDFDFVIKKNVPADYSNILTDEFAGMIIPLSKTKNHAYIDKIDEMIQKVSKDGYIHQDVSFSVIPQDLDKPLLELFCDKKEFNLYLDYKNIQVTKSKVKAFMTEGCSFDKVPYSMFIEGSAWADKSSQKVWHDSQLDAFKKAQGTFLNDIFDDNSGAIKGSRNIYTNNEIFVDKKDKMCYYDYNTTWADKSSIDAKIHAQLTADKENREAHMLDCVSPAIRKNLEGFYDYGVFGNKSIQESQLSQQINDVHKKAYDTKIHPDDFGNWGWVYEDPDPFDGGFGVDELLLPENDTRYEDFENIIFDKENMAPRNPIKEVNENTFIAKYPIRHPLPKYKDVGINYEDSAFKLDQFYGIEVSVMHDVFLKFYRIWQAKIFEFGTMTMTQSVKLMLEYLYSWIFIYFPVEKVEQALRVFRLIRWYGETSIIRNSQYIITYEYDTLESKLNTGTCLVPNDLDTQDTMYVDAALGVIRNNPTYINNGPAYVTFEVNNKKNTTFTFSLSNTIGSVNIYINDVLVDIVSKSALNLTYDLPYTGDTNVVKIEKPASHNLNSVFYIGNIKVPNCTFKDLSIEFDPNLKAGNKPLNEIAKKMISYANLYEDKDGAYEIIRKGNLGVEGIQKDLQEYWKLHHQNKTKGKRLTIKEI